MGVVEPGKHSAGRRAPLGVILAAGMVGSWACWCIAAVVMGPSFVAFLGCVPLGFLSLVILGGLLMREAAIRKFAIFYLGLLGLLQLSVLLCAAYQVLGPPGLALSQLPAALLIPIVSGVLSLFAAGLLCRGKERDYFEPPETEGEAGP